MKKVISFEITKHGKIYFRLDDDTEEKVIESTFITKAKAFIKKSEIDQRIKKDFEFNKNNIEKDNLLTDEIKKKLIKNLRSDPEKTKTNTKNRMESEKKIKIGKDNFKIFKSKIIKMANDLYAEMR